MAMKGYSTFPQTPGLKPHNPMVLCHIQHTRWWWRSYSSAEMQSAYSAAPADWAGKSVWLFTMFRLDMAHRPQVAYNTCCRIQGKNKNTETRVGRFMSATFGLLYWTTREGIPTIYLYFLSFRLNSSSSGEGIAWSMGVDRGHSNSMSKSRLLEVAFSIETFIAWTQRSAWPFDWKYLGDYVRCSNPHSLATRLKRFEL